MRALVTQKRLLQSFNPIYRISKSRIAQSVTTTAQMPKAKREIRTYKHTHSYLQVLGNGTDTGETTPSVLLFFDAYRYVFNVGEGFQRYCFQHRLKLGKLNDVFLTRMSTEAAGGVPGLLITLSEFGIGGSHGVTFKLHGPMKLDRFFNAVRSFVSIPDEQMCSNFGSEATEGVLGAPLVSNAQVEIRPILLLPQKQASNAPSPFLTDEEVPDLQTLVPAACYVCQLSDVKGKFLPDKAKALGVAVGPDFAKLVSGCCVESATGGIVHPHEVMEPTLPGPTVIIVDCPDLDYTSCLFSATGFERYFKCDAVVVHLTPFEVATSVGYVNWMAKFSSQTQHIFVNEKATHASAIMRKAAVIQTKLNLVDGGYFPLPKMETVHQEWRQEGIVSGKDLLRYHLKPLGKKGVDASQLLEPFDGQEIVSNFKTEDPSAMTAIEQFHERRKAVRQTQCPVHIQPDELEITFLGTGSAIPSKYRNVTGIYLDFFDRGSMILDCGEGSYGQLIRRLGRQGAEEAVKKLKHVSGLSCCLILMR